MVMSKLKVVMLFWIRYSRKVGSSVTVTVSVVSIVSSGSRV